MIHKPNAVKDYDNILIVLVDCFLLNVWQINVLWLPMFFCAVGLSVLAWADDAVRARSAA